VKVLTVRIPDTIEKKIRVKASLEHRSVSEQIKKYLYDGLICEDNPDLPLSFIHETLEAKAEVEAGLGQEYTFGRVK